MASVVWPPRVRGARPASIRLVLRRIVPLALPLALVLGCGAKTGLEIPEYEMDAAVVPVDGGVDTGVCMPARVPLEPETAELMLVIDRSASMRLTIQGEPDQPVSIWRWTILSGAMADALASIDPRVLVGAKFFPDEITTTMPTTEQACAASTRIDVAPAAGSHDAILSLFTSTDPNGGTPTAIALQAAATAFHADQPRRFLLLATDGAPNCNPDTGVPQEVCVCTSPPMACVAPRPGPYSCLDDVRTLSVVRDIAAQGIPTYVVGIEDLSRPDFSDVLDQMAVAGGRPRSVPGERQFYSVRSADQLHQALMDITGSISACGFTTPTLPGPEARFSIVVDGVTITQDDVNGWTWVDRAAGQLELHGNACAAAQGAARVEALIDDCPR